MTRTKAPFDADLNLGPLPRKQTIRVVAFGPTGRSVGEDEYIVNEGREAFRVRILSPEKGARVSGPDARSSRRSRFPKASSSRSSSSIRTTPASRRSTRRPTSRPSTIKDSKSLCYVRVVGTLDDGTVSEDLRYVNAPEFVSEVTVDAVELYTTVTDKGKPVNHLQASNFKVFEDGVHPEDPGFRVRQEPADLRGPRHRHVGVDARLAPRGRAGRAEVPRLTRSA